MTTSTALTIRGLQNFPDIHKFTVGFDQLFDELNRVTQIPQASYPPYNLIKYTDDTFGIELAVAGFTEGDIEVVLNKNQLVISGKQKESSTDSSVEYLHRGISSRNFTRNFTLADYVEVTNASVTNGILTIELERKIPQHAKPKNIAISYNK